MSKRILALATALIMLLLVGCNAADGLGDGGDNENVGDLESGNGGEEKESGENNMSRTDGFTLKATVQAVNEDFIEVEVIESDYAFGIYHVRTGEQTEYKNADGQISRSDIKPGDTLIITYSGQTMMSYPPQIVAWSIEIK